MPTSWQPVTGTTPPYVPRSAWRTQAPRVKRRHKAKGAIVLARLPGLATFPRTGFAESIHHSRVTPAPRRPPRVTGEVLDDPSHAGYRR